MRAVFLSFALLIALAHPAGASYISNNSGGGSGGITSINTDTTADQTITQGTSGTDFAVSTSAGTTTINLPSASATARGAVTTSAQTFAGVKTFSSPPLLSSLTASRACYLDASKQLAASATTNTELGYLSGVTSAVQTQLDAKEPAITTLSIAKGGTNSGTSLNNNRVMKSSGGGIVEAAAITASRALVSDANGIPTHSSVTSTELGYVSGVTSGIQSQLDGKQATGSYVTSLTGEATGSGPGATAVTLTNSAVIGKVLTGFSSSAGTVAATDTILQAFNKVVGNIALKLNAASPSWTGTMNTPLTASRAIVTDSSSNLAVSSVTSTELGYLSGVTSALQTQLNAKATTTGFAEEFSGHIETMSNKTYYVIAKSAVARQVVEIYQSCSSGSVTTALKIGGTNITTCNGMSVTTTPGTTTCDTGSTNDLGAGGQLTLVGSSNSSCTDYYFSIKTTRD